MEVSRTTLFFLTLADGDDINFWNVKKKGGHQVTFLVRN